MFGQPCFLHPSDFSNRHVPPFKLQKWSGLTFARGSYSFTAGYRHYPCTVNIIVGADSAFIMLVATLLNNASGDMPDTVYVLS